MIPTTSTYCNNTNPANAQRINTDGLTVYYSYRTCVAFWTPSTGLLVRQNEWGPTTGKHINAIDGGDKSSRIASAEFVAQLRAATRQD